MNIIQTLQVEMKNLPDDWIVLLEVPAGEIMNSMVSLMKFFMENKYIGTIISATRPAKNLMELYEKNLVNTEGLTILDCISKTHSTEIPEVNGVLFMESAASLTDISLSLTDFMDEKGEKKFIMLDSINSMLIHNDGNTFARFIHSILTKMRINNVNGVIISVKGNTDEIVRAEIAQLCDKVITV